MPITEAGIDYLTLHTPLWSDERPLDLYGLVGAYSAWRGERHQLGFQRLLGYEGLGDEHFFVGEREDGYLRRLSGMAAEAFHSQVAIPSDRPTRVDVQVTWQQDTPLVEAIERHQAEAETASASSPSTRRRMVHIHKDNRGGCTLYVGSRHSERFARIYNKEAQSREDGYKGCIRYEMELKSEYAHSASRLMLEAGENRSEMAVRIVYEQLRVMGVSPPFNPREMRGVRLLATVPRPSTETTMVWLRDQVRPAITRLLRVVPARDIIALLGLSPETEPDSHPG